MYVWFHSWNLTIKPWSHQANGRVMDKKSFYLFISILCLFLIRRIRSLSGDVWWCSFRPVLSFEHVQNYPTDKMDRDARLMYGHYVAYTLHKLIARVSSVRGDEFCHQITKFCMFCPLSLRNKSVCRFDQALKELPAFSPFPKTFSRSYFPRVFQRWYCVLKDYAPFSPFPTMFSYVSFFSIIKTWDNAAQG